MLSRQGSQPLHLPVIENIGGDDQRARAPLLERGERLINFAFITSGQDLQPTADARAAAWCPCVPRRRGLFD
jgi:hypothetical protein